MQDTRSKCAEKNILSLDLIVRLRYDYIAIKHIIINSFSVFRKRKVICYVYCFKKNSPFSIAVDWV